MSNFKEQLSSITDNEIKTILNSGQVSDFEIVNRGIVPIGSIEVSVEGNTNSDIHTFQMNRYFDGVDLSSKYIRIGFQTVSGTSGYTDASNIVTDSSGDIFWFDWIVDSKATIGAGKIKVKVECYEKDTSSKTIYSWNTKEIELKVLPTFNVFCNAVPRNYSLEKTFYNSHDNNTDYTDIHDTDPPIMIDGRDILMIDHENIIVERDERSQIITFVMKRNRYDFDPANMTIAIGFENAIGQSDWSVCVNRIVTDTEVTFGWLLDSKVSFESGEVKFRVELMGYNSKNEWMDWKTKTSTFTVHRSFPIDTGILNSDPSFEQKWIIESEDVLNRCKAYAEDASQTSESLKVATLVTNWNDAVTTGYYYSVDFDDLNHPPMGDSIYSGYVRSFPGYIRQTVCGLITNQYMTRFKDTEYEKWSEWVHVSPDKARNISFDPNADILSQTVQSAIQEVYDKKVNKETGKTLSTNDYTTEEKEKLAGIDKNANKYVHPDVHPISMIQIDDITSLEKFLKFSTYVADWNMAINQGFYWSYPNESNAPDGLSESGFCIFGIVLSMIHGCVKQYVTTIGGKEIFFRSCSNVSSEDPKWSVWKLLGEEATAEESGLMSASDKKKLDQIVPMTESEYQSAVKDPDAYYLVG